MFRSHVMVCGGTGCTSSGSDKIAEAFEDEILATGLENEVKVIRTGCFGLCALGPIVVIYPEGSFYSMVKEEDVKEIVDEHLLKGRPVTRLLYDETVAEDNTVKSLDDTAFYKKQMRIALRNCGVINPENIDEYIAFDGYAGAGQGAHRNDAGRRSSRRSWTPACAAAAAQASPPACKWQLAAGNRGVIRNMYAATPTRATPAHLWTAPCWRATPMSSSRPWPLRAMPSAPARATFMSAPSIPSRCTVCRSPSARRANTACWATISSAPASALIWTSSWAPAPSCAARRPR